jgi:hypothetical protein
MASWPLFMPNADSEGYAEKPGDPLLITQMQSGPPQARGQGRAVTGLVTCQYLLDQATDALFDDYLTNTLRQGTIVIDDWPHPRRKVPVRAYLFANYVERGSSQSPLYIWVYARQVFVLS